MLGLLCNADSQEKYLLVFNRCASLEYRLPILFTPRKDLKENQFVANDLIQNNEIRQSLKPFKTENCFGIFCLFISNSIYENTS